MLTITTMTDFEVHPIGTAEELRLSRALANSIDEIVKQYGKVIPNDVYQQYLKLKECYEKQLRSEML